MPSKCLCLHFLDASFTDLSLKTSWFTFICIWLKRMLTSSLLPSDMKVSGVETFCPSYQSWQFLVTNYLSILKLQFLFSPPPKPRSRHSRLHSYHVSQPLLASGSRSPFVSLIFPLSLLSLGLQSIAHLSLTGWSKRSLSCLFWLSCVQVSSSDWNCFGSWCDIKELLKRLS